MAVKKRLLLIPIGILLIYFSAEFFINYTINEKLPKTIEQRNDTPYCITFKKVHINLLLARATLHDVHITYNDSLHLKQSSIKDIKLKSVYVNSINYKSLLLDKKFDAHSLILNDPVFTLQSKSGAHASPNLTLGQQDLGFKLKKIKIKNAQLLFYDIQSQASHVVLQNLNLVFDHIKQGQKSLSSSLYLSFTNTASQRAEYLNEMDKNFTIKAEQISLEQNNFYITGLNAVHNLTPTTQPDSITEVLSIHASKFDIKAYQTTKNNTGKLSLSIDSLITERLKIDIAHYSPKKKLIEHAIKDPLEKLDLSIENIQLNDSEFTFAKYLSTSIQTMSLEHTTTTVNHSLDIQQISLDNAIVNYHPKTNPTKSQHASSWKFPFIIHNFKIDNSQFLLTDPITEQQELKVANFQGQISEIRPREKVSEQNTLPEFTIDHLSLQSISYQPNPDYMLLCDSIFMDNKDIKLYAFEMQPIVNKYILVKQNKYAIDVYNVKLDSLHINKHHIGVNSQDKIALHFANTIIYNPYSEIYRNKTKALDPKNKPLFSAQLRAIDFPLQLDTITLKNAHLIYLEDDQNAVEPGMLRFNKLHAKIHNVRSGASKLNEDLTRIDVKARFMDASNLNVHWWFNVDDQRDSFHIKGSLSGFNASALTPFLQPYLKVSTQGQLDQVWFDFVGNKDFATGDFAIDYHNLKVTLYRKDAIHKRALLTGLSNLLINKNAETSPEKVEIKKVEPATNKSFFNYLWSCILQGLKQTVL